MRVKQVLITFGIAVLFLIIGYQLKFSQTGSFKSVIESSQVEHHSPPPVVIEPGSGVETASYIIFHDEEVPKNYYVKNGNTGEIMGSNTDAATVINGVIGLLTNGGRIYVKGGLYNITATIEDQNVNNITLEGEGMYNTIFKAADGLGDHIIDLTHVSGWTLRNFQVDGNDAQQTYGSSTCTPGLQCYGTEGLTLENLYVHHVNGYAVYVVNSVRFTVNNIHILQSANWWLDGLHFTDVQNGTVSGGNIIAGDDALVFRADRGNVENVAVSNFYLSSWNESGINLGQSQRSQDAGEIRFVRGISVSNVVIDGTGWQGIHIATWFNDVSFAEDCSFSNIVIRTIDEMGIKLAHCRRITFSGIVISNVRKEGIYIGAEEYASDIVIDGFSVENVGHGPIQAGIRLGHAPANCTRIKISNGIVNNVVNPDNAGILLRNTTYSEITNVQINDIAGSYAILEWGDDNDYNQIKHNTILDGTISKVGEHTIVKDNFGYVTENNGTATIPAGSTSVPVTHDLVGIPKNINLSPQTSDMGKWYKVSSKTSSQFVITIDSAHTSDITFDWYAEV